MSDDYGLRLEERDGGWGLAGPAASGFVLVHQYLAHLVDRNYSPKTVRAYGYDLLAFCRWLVSAGEPLAGVTTQVLLRFLHACREATVAGRPGPNVVTLSGARMDQYAATTSYASRVTRDGMRICLDPTDRDGMEAVFDPATGIATVGPNVCALDASG